MTETFAIAPAGTRSLYVFIPILFVIVAAMGFALVTLGSAAFASTRARFELGPDGLRIRGGEVLYRSFVPRAALELDAARVVDLSRETSLRPARRTMGTALPGYAGGWFRLENGQKALVYLTERSRAVLVPTRDGYVVLLSPSDPEGMVKALHALAEH